MYGVVAEVFWVTFLGKFRAFLELPFGVMCFLGELRVGLMLALGGLRAGFMWLYSAWFRLRFCASPPASRKRRVYLPPVFYY